MCSFFQKCAHFENKRNVDERVIQLLKESLGKTMKKKKKTIFSTNDQ
jgi:hypothetical protein